MSDESYCDVTERLFGEFERVHRLPVIAAVVRQCQVQLEGAAKGSVPELLSGWPTARGRRGPHAEHLIRRSAWLDSLGRWRLR